MELRDNVHFLVTFLKLPRVWLYIGKWLKTEDSVIPPKCIYIFQHLELIEFTGTDRHLFDLLTQKSREVNILNA